MMQETNFFFPRTISVKSTQCLYHRNEHASVYHSMSEMKMTIDDALAN
jgi:hypothetical protein